MSDWYVLECDGGYLGMLWQPNGTGGIVRPRVAVVPSLDPPIHHYLSLCHGLADAQACAVRVEGILGIRSHPVAVDFAGAGKNARIVAHEKPPQHELRGPATD